MNVYTCDRCMMEFELPYTNDMWYIADIDIYLCWHCFTPDAMIVSWKGTN